MNAQHTPGPWIVHDCSPPDSDSERVIVVRWQSNGLTLAHLVNYSVPERRANARLIAAAPELLDACQKALYALKGREHDQFLRDAIARATGAE